MVKALMILSLGLAAQAGTAAAAAMMEAAAPAPAPAPAPAKAAGACPDIKVTQADLAMLKASCADVPNICTTCLPKLSDWLAPQVPAGFDPNSVDLSTCIGPVVIKLLPSVPTIVNVANCDLQPLMDKFGVKSMPPM